MLDVSTRRKRRQSEILKIAAACARGEGGSYTLTRLYDAYAYCDSRVVQGGNWRNNRDAIEREINRQTAKR